MKRRNGHTLRGIGFVGACVLFAVIIFNAVKVEKVASTGAANAASETTVVNTYQPDVQLSRDQSSDAAPVTSSEDSTAAMTPGPAQTVIDQEETELTLNRDEILPTL